jgi:hypothetical protein
MIFKRRIKLSELITKDTQSCKSWNHPRKNMHKRIFITYDEIKDLLSRGIDKVSVEELEMYLFEMRL